MSTIIFSFDTDRLLANYIAAKMQFELGEISYRDFPDNESYVRIQSHVAQKDVIIVCSLNHPNKKFFPLFFLAKTAKDLGANSVRLVAPYLGYMRQDKAFNPGEAVTSKYFAHLLSQGVDELITVDPHLHRYHSLSEIYSIPTQVLHAGEILGRWIQKNVPKPLLIGPDMESKQWVADVAGKINAPFIILLKTRKGDRDVEVSVPNVDNCQDCTPVLIDDIISTAHTMIETIKHLKKAGMKPPICIGVHAVFAGDAYEKLLHAGIEKVVTCDTIEHVSNNIEIGDLLIEALKQ